MQKIIWNDRSSALMKKVKIEEDLYFGKLTKNHYEASTWGGNSDQWIWFYLLIAVFIKTSLLEFSCLIKNNHGQLIRDVD
jgi:hypothetical protein